MLGYLSIGFAAGVVEKTAGLSIVEIALISLLLYAGSGQFIAAGMIAAAHPISAIVFTIFFVNSRHLLLSAALAPYFQNQTTKQNIITGALLTDETFGVAITNALNKKHLNYKWMLGLNLTAYLNWALSECCWRIFWTMDFFSGEIRSRFCASSYVYRFTYITNDKSKKILC